MPLTPEIIDDTVDRYSREYDRYAKMAEYVADKCRELLGDSIRASVTWRAKEPGRLEGKLRDRFLGKDEGATLDSVQNVFDHLGDLAAVRISTYEDGVRLRVVEMIKKMFCGQGNVDVRPKDISKDLVNKYYRATHCNVYLKQEDLNIPRYSNLAGMPCEIQVCSLLAHVWNEVEHDLAYKPTTGELSEKEKELLQALGRHLLVGDQLIKELYEAVDHRLKANQGRFRDVHDFVTRMRDFFKSCDSFDIHADALLEYLKALHMDSLDEIINRCGDPQHYEQIGLNELRIIDERLGAVSNTAANLSFRSSDVFLMVLLKNCLDEVLALRPAGQRRGRPPRIAMIAQFVKVFYDLMKTIEKAQASETSSLTYPTVTQGKV